MEIRGGDKLDAALNAIAKNVKKGGTLRVGFISGNSYPDGTSVALVAAINEFGAPSRGQPPRPFFRLAIQEHSPEWPRMVANMLLANNYDGEKALDLLGHEIVGEVQDSILKLTEPPLAPATISAKGHDKPLIDSGLMKNSVSHEVESQ